MAAPLLSTTTRPESLGYAFALGDLLLRAAVSPDRPLVIRTAELQPPRFQVESSPEEALSTFGDVFSVSDVTGGEGLLNRHRRRGTAADATRFWASENVDVSPASPGAPEEIRLLHTTARIDAISGVVRTAHDGPVLWATSGESIRKTSNVLAASPSFAADDPHDGEDATDVTDVAVLGDTPYAALGDNGVHRDTGSGWNHWSDTAAVRVWSVLDRIVASDGTGLYEADAGAGSTLLYALPQGTEWTDCADAGEAILASASNGYVYSFTVNDSGDLEVAGQTRMEGETPVTLAARAGHVWVGTQDGDESRLWEATLSDRLTLTNLQLLREWDGDVGEIHTSRDRVLVGVHETDTSYVWRVELSTQGLSKAHKLANGAVDGLTVIESIVVAGVNDDGIYRQTSTLHADGWLIGPLADFFRAEDKSWVTGWADVKASGGEKVELFYTTERAGLFNPDHTSWRRVRTYHDDSAGEELSLGTVVSRSLAGMVRLSRSSGDTSPKVRSFSFRAYPTGGDVLMQLPVDVGDQIERRGRRRLRVAGWGNQVYEALRDLEGVTLLCQVFSTSDTIRGIVESVATPIPALTPLGSPTVMSVVSVRGRRVPEFTDIGEGGWMGGFVMGGEPLGGTV